MQRRLGCSDQAADLAHDTFVRAVVAHGFGFAAQRRTLHPDLEHEVPAGRRRPVHPTAVQDLRVDQDDVAALAQGGPAGILRQTMPDPLAMLGNRVFIAQPVAARDEARRAAVFRHAIEADHHPEEVGALAAEIAVREVAMPGWFRLDGPWHSSARARASASALSSLASTGCGITSRTMA